MVLGMVLLAIAIILFGIAILLYLEDKRELIGWVLLIAAVIALMGGAVIDSQLNQDCVQTEQEEFSYG